MVGEVDAASLVVHGADNDAGSHDSQYDMPPLLFAGKGEEKIHSNSLETSDPEELGARETSEHSSSLETTLDTNARSSRENSEAEDTSSSSDMLSQHDPESVPLSYSKFQSDAKKTTQALRS